MKRAVSRTDPGLVLLPGLIASWAGTFGWWPLALGAGLGVALAVHYADYIFSPVSIAHPDVTKLAEEIQRYRYIVRTGALLYGAAQGLCLPLMGLAGTLRVGGCMALGFSGVLARYAWLRRRWRHTLAARMPDRRPH